MAHQPKPFFRSGRGWYVQLGTKQIKLSNGPKTGETEKTAWAAFHKLMATPPAATRPVSANSATGITVAEVFEKFLDWCQKHRSPRTYQLAQKHIQSFCDHLNIAPTLAHGQRVFRSL